MEQRLANSLHLTINEKTFMETALLLLELRVDGRGPFDYRKLTTKFGRQLNFVPFSHSTLFKTGRIFFRPFMLLNVFMSCCREDGSSEVQLGHTHVMAFVTSLLVQPYRCRPNEGTVSMYTEFSPTEDPSYEQGRAGESAVELGRIMDRGLRPVDTESLRVPFGKLVWAIRIDIHVLDNGGNLVDAANIAALAALLTFQRPECILRGEDGQLGSHFL
ncbi:exosome complex component RRP45B-like isoform X2 [Prosopis cineraria]|uniref:exosome complex component RRP45B-like isoform X2 n=1 Tax=Prosopis cineraria TaxID=364024 RepID=UPI00240F383B|nr:exosome complex component RRP45B-like isoform X2 [Prosopis cineraria]